MRRRWSLVLAALSLMGCSTAESFRRACLDTERGTPLEEADRALTGEGGRHWTDAYGVHYWTRPRHWFSFTIAQCKATLDPDDRVIETQYSEYIDVL
jgi:hypothetical protein